MKKKIILQKNSNAQTFLEQSNAQTFLEQSRKILQRQLRLLKN